jgi:cell division septum initiation protein DivIVA
LCNLCCCVIHSIQNSFILPARKSINIYKSTHPSTIYKRAATPIMPATTPVRPPIACEFAAPVNWAAREDVAEAATDAAREVADEAAEAARLVLEETAAAADDARLDATAAAEEARLDAEAAAEEARLDAEAAADDTTTAAEEARDDAAERADERIGAIAEGTAVTEGTAGREGVLRSDVRRMLSRVAGTAY